MVVPVYRVTLVREEIAPGASPRSVLRASADAAALLRPLFEGLDREQFVVILLDARHRPIGMNVVSVGSLTASIVHPREVFRPAVALPAAAVILAHNHPSGDPAPSPEDAENHSPASPGGRDPRHLGSRSRDPRRRRALQLPRRRLLVVGARSRRGSARNGSSEPEWWSSSSVPRGNGDAVATDERGELGRAG